MRSLMVIFGALLIATSTAALILTTYLLISEPWEDDEQVQLVPSPSPSVLNQAAIGPDWIWNIDDGALTALQDCGPLAPACVMSAMDERGASTTAKEFFLWSGLFLTEFTELGIIDLGQVLDPWLANSNVKQVLLNGVPRLVFPADIPRGEREEPSCAFIWQEFPNAIVWPFQSTFDGIEGTSNGGQMYVFSFNVGEFRIEEPKYQIRAGFEFSPGGSFVFARWLPCREG